MKEFKKEVTETLKLFCGGMAFRNQILKRKKNDEIKSQNCNAHSGE